MKSIKKISAFFTTFLMSAAAMAGTTGTPSDSTFEEFATTTQDWAKSGLGVGLATTMLLMGSAIGVAKNSPMPALSGIGGAAFLHWGPSIIQNLVQGAVL